MRFSLIEVVFIFTQRLSNLSLANLTTKCWPFSVEHLERCVDQWAPSCWAITVKCRGRERKPWPTISDLFQSVAQDVWQLPMLTLGATIVTRGLAERRATKRLEDDKKEKTLILEQDKESELLLERKEVEWSFEGGIRTQISHWWYCSDPGVGPAELQLSQAPHADSWKCQLQILWKFIAAEVSPQKILPRRRLARCSLAEAAEAVPNFSCQRPDERPSQAKAAFRVLLFSGKSNVDQDRFWMKDDWRPFCSGCHVHTFVWRP